MSKPHRNTKNINHSINSVKKAGTNIPRFAWGRAFDDVVIGTDIVHSIRNQIRGKILLSLLRLHIGLLTCDNHSIFQGERN